MHLRVVPTNKTMNSEASLAKYTAWAIEKGFAKSQEAAEKLWSLMPDEAKADWA